MSIDDELNIVNNQISSLEETKDLIKNAIIDQGVTVSDTDTFRSYADKIGEISNGSSGFSLFDLVPKDHLLTYDESEGFGLLGTYVYKNAVAGSRYGYPEFYNKCLEEYNDEDNTTETLMMGENAVTISVNSNGHKFYNIADKALIDEIYNNTGMAWYYGVDTENERIFLPRAKSSFLRGDFASTAPVIGNGLSLGLTNGTSNYSLSNVTGVNANLSCWTTNQYGQSVGHTGSVAVTPTPVGSAIGVTTDAANSGLVADLSNLDNDIDLYIYIVVGNTSTVQSTTVEIISDSAEAPLSFDSETGALKLSKSEAFTITNGDLDITSATLNTKGIRTVVETSDPSLMPSWYRIYSDGWVEQGGITNVSYSSASTTVTLIKNYSSVNYTVTCQVTGYSASGVIIPAVPTRNTNSFVIFGDNSSSSGTLTTDTMWCTCGY